MSPPRRSSNATSACACTPGCARSGPSHEPSARGPRARRRDLRPPPQEAKADRAEAASSPRGRARRRRRLRPPVRRRRRGCHRRCDVRLQLRPERSAAGLDRPELLHLCGEQLDPRRDPRRAKPSAGAALEDQPLDAGGDRRDRGPPLLPPRRHRRRGDRACALEERERGRGGRRRLDDHAAARPQPLHQPRAHGPAEAEGGVPRDQAERRLVEGPHPRHVHEPGVLRQPGVRDRGGCADLLLEERRRAEPPRGGSPCRLAAAPEHVRPVQPHRDRNCAPEPCSAGDAQRGLHQARRSTTGP